MATEADTANQKAELCPAGIRPSRVAIPPAWDIVRVSLDKETTGVRDTKISSQNNVVDDNHLPDTQCGRSDMALLAFQGDSFERIVARTSSALACFIKEIHGDHLLLFPHIEDHKTSFIELMKNQSERGDSQNGIMQINYDHKLFFLRVLLYAYKEGVFEEGAVVCAPRVTDVLLWTSRYLFFKISCIQVFL